MIQPILDYAPNGALHHLLHGIKFLISGNAEASCTWSQISTWSRLNPCGVEQADLKHLLDKLVMDRHVEITATGGDGLSAGSNTNIRVKLLGTGLLMLSRLNIRRTASTPKGSIAGRKEDICGVTSPFDRPPAARQGSDEFRAAPSRTGETATPYDSAQGMGRAAQ